MLPHLSDIKRRRTALRVTQADLAKTSGVSQSLIAKIENGSTDPVYSKLKRIFDTLERLEHEGNKTAIDIMSSTVYTVSNKDLLKKAVKLMKTHGISQVPVIEGGRCIGSISDRTLLRVFSGDIAPEEIIKHSVTEFMDAPFPTVEAESPLKAVSNLLSVYPAVLVTSEGKIAGIITRADLF